MQRPCISHPQQSAFCPTLFSLQSFIYFSPLLVLFSLLSLPGFSPCMSLTFPFPPPQGSLLSQLTDICQWRNITTIADVEMLIPSSLNFRATTPGLQHIPAGSLRTACSCFCLLKRPAVGPDREAPAVNDQSLLLIHADV